MCDINLNKEQMEAFEAAMAGKEDIFITGGAGTGKSFLIELIRNNKEVRGENVAVCAFTGIAARNVNGTTVHRLFNLGIGPIVSKNVDPPIVLSSVDCIIIDEISMLRCDVFEYVMKAVKKARKVFEREIQLIVVGDFYQLPPVLTDERGEKDVLVNHYGTEKLGKLYAFQSPLWQFRCVELKKIIRQENPDFSRALNMIRKGDSFGLSWLDMHKAENPVGDAPFGVSSNREVKKINAEKMEELDASTERRYSMIIQGSVNENDYKPQEKELVVRRGMMVMVLINDTNGLKADFVNGSVGRVVEAIEDGVTVKLLDNNLLYKFPYMGIAVLEYRINQHGLLQISEVGKWWQIPLKPCYALTVHKLQGMTLDALNLTPANWEDGLLYTALSRVKDVSNLYYDGNLSDLAISCNKDVAEFYKNPDSYKYDWEK